MTIGKKVSRIGGERVVEIDAEICKLAKNGRGKAESRSEEIVGALVRQDHSYARVELLRGSDRGSNR
jgi:hypothetical protein